MPLSPAEEIRRVVPELRLAAMGHAPGSRMEDFYLAVSSWLESEAEALDEGWSRPGEPSTDHAVAVARAWLGEIDHA